MEIQLIARQKIYEGELVKRLWKRYVRPIKSSFTERAIGYVLDRAEKGQQITVYLK